METVKETIVRTYQNYIKEFQSLKPAAIVPFYHMPFMSVSSQRVRVLTTPSEIEQNFGRHMEILKKYDYVKTKITDINIKELSEGLALMSVSLERFASDGEQIGSENAISTYTYTFRKVADDWKIVVTMAHDALLRLD